MIVVTRSARFHPSAAEVCLTRIDSREIGLHLGDGFELRLWPGAANHDEQVEWLKAVEEKLRIARQMMTAESRSVFL